MYDLIIKNGTVVNATGSVKNDLAISNGKIALVSTVISEPDTPVLDGSGKLLLPGGVDPHTHFDIQAGSHHSVDDFAYGGHAALAGGATTVVDHPGFGPRDCDLDHQVEAYHKLAGGRCCVDYGFHGLVQHWNDQVSADMEKLREAGIPSVKAYMTYDFKLDDNELQQLFQRAAELDMLVAVHAEDDDTIVSLRRLFAESALLTPYYHALSRPNSCESRAVERALRAAKRAGDAPVYIVHLSTREGLAAVRHAREQGQQNIFVETCPQYLLLDSRRYLEQPDGLKYIMSPPLRSPADNDALWHGLANGEIQCVGSDHCSFSFSRQKQAGAVDFRLTPGGAPGVEERLPLLYTFGVGRGRLSLERLAEGYSTNPARLFGLYPNKGLLAAGADADIVVFNPQISRRISVNDMHGACDHTLYEGMNILGDVETVISNGRVAYSDHKVRIDDGGGRFLERRMDRSLWAETK